jgi:FolB domain-containing protein
MLLKIKNLKLKTILGVHDWEENVDREIIINAEIETNATSSLDNEDLKDVVDYELIAIKIKDLVAKTRFRLIEKMTKEMLDKIMEDPRIIRCKLEIDKVGAVNFVESASITLEQNRSRNNGS